jgi:hypothetical protein
MAVLFTWITTKKLKTFKIFIYSVKILVLKTTHFFYVHFNIHFLAPIKNIWLENKTFFYVHINSFFFSSNQK